jgi:hypothetical protein
MYEVRAASIYTWLIKGGKVACPGGIFSNVPDSIVEGHLLMTILKLLGFYITVAKINIGIISGAKIYRYIHLLRVKSLECPS